ncbi:MAG: hypothetical protein JW825_00805 [Candidatus Methanofastidiosa archaeon]|nr:hypothetical protein [Candidatus Methanofastidiosa archaeon]
MKYKTALLIFTMMVCTILVFNTQAYTSFNTEREVVLQTADDRYGLISLNPYGENGIYFVDEGNDGTYGFQLSDIPLEEVTYDNVMGITNNLNNPVTIKISDYGDYDGRVDFLSNGFYLESTGRVVPVGETIYVDLSIDATGLEDTQMLETFNIMAYQDDNEIYYMHRDAYLVTTAEETYDPYANDMPTNAAYLKQLAYDVLESGGTIREGSNCYEDLGLDPDIWDNEINGYRYYYYNDYNGVIKIVNKSQKIYMSFYGIPISVNKNTGILLSVYEDYYYVKIGRNWYPPAYLWSYY